MTRFRLNHVLFVFFVPVCLATPFFTPVSPDVGIVLHTAEKILSGQKLYIDIIGMNPPLVYMLALIPVHVSALLNVPSDLFFFLVMTALICLPLSLCRYLASKVWPGEHWIAKNISVLLIFICFVLLKNDYLQRDYLFIIFFFPYVLLLYCRIMNIPVNLFAGSAVCLTAAVGIALKPFFLVPWLFLELYRLLIAKESLYRYKWDIVIILIFQFIYFLVIVIYYSEYFSIVPMAVQTYDAFNKSAVQILSKKVIHLGAFDLKLYQALLITAIPGFLPVKSKNIRKFIYLLYILMAGILIEILAQKKGFRYHYKPIVFTMIMCWIFIIAERLINLTNTRYINNIILSVLLLSGASGLVARINQSYREYKNIPECLFPMADKQKGTYGLMKKLLKRGDEVTVLSSWVSPPFPHVLKLGITHTSGFDHLWMLPGCYKNEIYQTGTVNYHAPEEMSAAERFAFDKVVEDFIANDPDCLIVDTREKHKIFHEKYFDYIRYFGQDKRFANQFKKYRLWQTKYNYSFYRKV